ncbi:MAG: zeta toxin family protein [Rhodospirillales bacterium]|nr:zeta toxin family protein [Rhodospirillales bacterium]MCB9995114.1 zeta toxin family protein [Rhodospirillales bacterium]
MKPKLIIFAGANGSGKTTAAEYLLPRLRVKEFVNADEIARGLSPMNAGGQALAAGKLVLSRTDDLIVKGRSFAIETTLSGNHLKKIIKKAHDADYIIEMHYIFCADINLNLKRIKYRVQQGGHHVPADDVRRRYWRSLKNWLVYKNMCDIMALYDTTAGNLVKFAHKTDGIEGFVIYDSDLAKRFSGRVIEARDDH